MRTLLLAAVLAATATSAQAQSLQLSGKVGYLQEWELAATVARRDAGRKHAFSGPLTLRHVGLCSSGGIEEKSGEISLEMAGASHAVKAKLTIDGRECAFSGTLSEASAGVMECPGSQGIPLSLWIKTSGSAANLP